MFQLILLLFIILVLLNSLFKWFHNTKKHLPPSPPKLPIIGNMHQLGIRPHRNLQKYGPLILLHLGQIPVLVVNSPNVAREIMKTHDQIFSSRPKSTVYAKLTYNRKDVIFSPYGEYWRQVRSIFVHNLLSNKRVQSYKTVMVEEILAMVEKIMLESDNEGTNISAMFKLLMNDVASRVAIGFKISQGENGRRFTELLGHVVEVLDSICMGDCVPWLWWVDRVNGLSRKIERTTKGIDEFLQATINDHLEKTKSTREVSDGKNFLEILLDMQTENQSEFPISNDTVKALMLDLFVAGTDSTSAAMEWIVAELLKHPQVKMKLQNEVREVMKEKPNITEEDLEKMSYLKLVIKESFRLHPPAPMIPRESTEEAKIQGYDVEAGTQVLINLWAIGRDPLAWKDPDEFKPERFLNSSIDFKGFDFELITFGAFRRGCPGTQFSILVIELAIATLLYKFDIALPPGKRVEDLEMIEAPGFNSHVKSPIIIAVKPYAG